MAQSGSSCLAAVKELYIMTSLLLGQNRSMLAAEKDPVVGTNLSVRVHVRHI